MPTPIAVWLLLGRETDDGVRAVAAGEIDPPNELDGIEDVDTREFVEEETLVVVPVVSGPRLVITENGPGPNHIRDSLEQHPGSFRP